MTQKTQSGPSITHAARPVAGCPAAAGSENLQEGESSQVVTSEQDILSQKLSKARRRTLRKQEMLTRLATAQRGLCFYCGEEMGEDRTAEHLLSKTDGGHFVEENIRAAHSGCNNEADCLPVAAKLRASEAGRKGGRRAFQREVRKALNERKKQRIETERRRAEQKSYRRARAAVKSVRSKFSGPET